MCRGKPESIRLSMAFNRFAKEAPMDYTKFSKSQLADILDLIQLAVRCTSEQELSDVTLRLKDMVEADNCVCALGNTEAIHKLVNINYPEEWMQRYAVEDYHKKDPIVQYNYTHFETHLWKDAITRYSDEPYNELMGMASDYGLNYGIAGGVNSEGYRGSIFSFCSDRDRFTQHHVQILDAIIPHVHQALARVCDMRKRKLDNLSKREMEVLTWMKEGKTNWEISVILSISERTVKFHVQNIERKLNAVNKAHAIAIAMDNGQAL